MDITQIYVITTGVVFGLCLMVRAALTFVRYFRPYNVLLMKHLLHRLALRRHRFFGPWTRAQVFFHLFYVATSIFCSTFRVSTVIEAATRAGTLSLVNMMPSYFGHHLSSVSDILGLLLLVYRRIHALTGAMSVFLGLFHAVVNVTNTTSLSLFSASGQLFGFIVRVRFLRAEYAANSIF